MIPVLVLYILFASTFTLGKAVLYYIKPIMFIGFRMSAAGLLLLGYQYFFNRSRWKLERRDIFAFAQVAFFLMFISFVTEFWALQYLSAAKACLLYNLSPFITALFAYWLSSEVLTWKQWLGLLIGILGFTPILVNQLPSERMKDHFLFLSTPELMLLVAVISSCYGWIVMRHLVTVRSYSAVMVNGVTMLAGGIVSLGLSIFCEQRPWIMPLSTTAPLSHVLLVIVGYTALLIFIANVIGFNLYSNLLRRYSPTFISFVGFSAPLFAALFDFLFFHERVPVSFFVTFIFVFVGIFVFYQDEIT